MTTYVLIIEAEDGRHARTFKSEARAIGALKSYVPGMGEGQYKVGHTYYSDWGRRLTIEERADGWNARTEEAVGDAYDARECETATKRQLALLAKHGM